MTEPTEAAIEQAGAPATTVTELTPTSYNLGVAVGWRRFAVSGDVSKVKSADPAFGGRETAIVGVSYSLNSKLTRALRSGPIVQRAIRSRAFARVIMSRSTSAALIRCRGR